MAFTTTAGSAEYVKSGTPGVAGIYTTKRQYDLSDIIILQERQFAKLDNILMQEMQVVTVTDPEPKVLTEQEAPVKFNIRSDGGTDMLDEDLLRISDTQAKFLQAGDVLQCPDIFCDSDGANYTTTKYGGGYTPETMIVESVVLSGAAANIANVVVARGNGYKPTSGVTTILSEYKLIRMANSLHDGGDAPVAKEFEPTDVQNFCQFISEVWGETDSESPLQAYGKQTMAQKAAKSRRKFFRGREYSSFFGRKSRTTGANGNLKWNTGGIVEFIPGASDSLDGESRFMDFGGAFDITKLREKTEIGYRYGSETKYWFCGGKFFTVLYNALEKFITVNDEFTRKYGWNVFDLELGHGIGRLNRHPLWTDQETATNNYAFDFVAIDIQYLKMMNYIPVSVRTVPGSRAHKREDEIFSQSGLYRMHPSAHFMVHGILG